MRLLSLARGLWSIEVNLGINKDLEPVVRQVRREGGEVSITRRNHVVWRLSDGTTIRSGLTMSSYTAQLKRKELMRALISARASVTIPSRAGDTPGSRARAC